MGDAAGGGAGWGGLTVDTVLAFDVVNVWEVSLQPGRHACCWQPQRLILPWLHSWGYTVSWRLHALVLDFHQPRSIAHLKARPAEGRVSGVDSMVR